MYNRHRRWSEDGNGEQILAEWRRDADQDQGPEWVVTFDAGVVRAHQHIGPAPAR